MRCAGCGLDLLTGARSCPRCGVALGTQVPPASVNEPRSAGGQESVASVKGRPRIAALIAVVLVVIAGALVIPPLIRQGEMTSPPASGLPQPIASGPAAAPASQAPVPPAVLPATILDAGQAHACLVTAGGGLRCWGNNGYGQLGDGSSTTRLKAVAVTGVDAVRIFSAGGSHTCAVTSGGGVTCWGSNESGQLGTGGSFYESTPVEVVGLGSVRAVSAGADHTCAVTSDGGVMCWGSNESGQLGDGSGTNQPTPVAVAGLGSVEAISAGDNHTCVVTGGGGVTCWGSNESGQLGDGSRLDQNTPVVVAGLGSVQAVSAGGNHTCVVTSDGGVSCWGSNEFGQLGDDSGIGQATPVVVAGLGSVQAISAGGNHTCAVTSDGGVSCWGSNKSGQLGDGTRINRSTPVEVARLGSVQAISAGGNHTCAVIGDRSVSCWGNNESGQLGNGKMTVPVEWSSVDAATGVLAEWYKGVCKGHKVTISAPYAGKTHPIAIIGPGSDPNSWAAQLAGTKSLKGLRPSGAEQVQLVACVTEKVSSAPSCGTYTRQSDGKRFTIHRRKDVVTVRIMVAGSGKEIRRTQFTRVPACQRNLTVYGDPPYYLDTRYVSAKTSLPYIVGFTKGSVRR